MLQVVVRFRFWYVIPRQDIRQLACVIRIVPVGTKEVKVWADADSATQRPKAAQTINPMNTTREVWWERVALVYTQNPTHTTRKHGPRNGGVNGALLRPAHS